MRSVCLVVQNVYDFDARVRRKAEALVAAGYLVDVLALRGPNAQKNYVLNGVNVQTIELGKARGSLARYVFEYATFLLWSLYRLPLNMIRRGYAVIDINSLPDFLVFSGMFARWMGAKLLLDLHEITPEFYMSKYRIAEDSWMVRTMKFLERISIAFADSVITINEPIEDLLVARGLPRSKSAVVMNAVDEAWFASCSSGLQQPDPEKFVMIYHGTLTNIYGLDLAIEAFALKHDQMPGAELWILGSGSEKDTLAGLVEKHGLGSKVKLTGQVSASEIPQWLSRSDAGILPIRRDVFLEFAFPNKLPEFIFSGKAVLVSRLKTIRHYFSDDAVAYFEPNDPVDMSVQMLRLYRDSALRAKLASRARQEYEPIRWDVMKQRYLTVVKNLIPERVKSPGQSHASAEGGKP